MNYNKVITILLPVLNEKNNLKKFEKFFLKKKFYAELKYLFIDDGSFDGSQEILIDLSNKYKNVNYLFRKNDKDISRSIIEGSKLINTKYFLLMDADFQHAQSNIKRIINELKKNEFDAIIGSRFIENANNYKNIYNLIRLNASKFFIFISKKLLNHNLTDPLSGFGVVKVKAIKYDKLYANGWKILFDIILSNKNLKYKEIGITINARQSGKSKLNLNVVYTFIKLILFHKQYD